jgi:3-oxoacyl-[acyl-carrier protein] reductase
MQLDLSEKTALVTGGAKGIGRACSVLLAESGATVIVNFRKSKDEAEQIRKELCGRGATVDIFQADMSIPQEIEALFEYIRAKFGRLDVLVNNAGMIKDNLLLSMTLADWDRVHDVNLRGAFLASKLAVELMLPRHAGKIINIASVGAIRGSTGQTNYAASKGGLVAFTRACAVELAARGIQVNAVLPGMIVTDMSSRMRKKAGEMLLKRIPAARFGQPEEVARLVLFLASAQADYITGQAVVIDGGLSIA